MKRQTHRSVSAILAAATLVIALAPASFADSTTGKSDKPKSPPPIKIKIGQITTSHDPPGKSGDSSHKKQS